LLDIAIAGGYIIKPSNGWYQRVNKETGEMLEGKLREKETMTPEFWTPIFETTDFKSFVKESYKIGGEIAALELELD